ncbi:MAG: hypothetical protein AAFU85_33205 [Planctomycetota bacterium]
MLAGHYATALVANQKFGSLEGSRVNSKVLFYFLVASQFPDLLWVVFHFMGLEPTTPDSLLDMTLKTLTVDMSFSHDLIPALFWTVVVYAAGRLLFSKAIGLAGGCLVVIHTAADYAAGYPHHLCGANTPSIGFAAYHSVPMIAVAWEAAFTVVALFLFFEGERKSGIRRTGWNAFTIVGLFVSNVLFMAFLAYSSLRQQFNLEIATAS